MVTMKQKKVIFLLLNGGIISGNRDRIIVFDRRRIPLLRIHNKTLDAVRKYCKKKNSGLVISIAAVRRQRKDSFVKKQYLLTVKSKQHEKAIDADPGVV